MPCIRSDEFKKDSMKIALPEKTELIKHTFLEKTTVLIMPHFKVEICIE